VLQDLRINLPSIRNSSLACHLHTPATIPLQPVARLAIALAIAHSVGLHTGRLAGGILVLHFSFSFLANCLVLGIRIIYKKKRLILF
jgi:hypothetical protein